MSTPNDVQSFTDEDYRTQDYPQPPVHPRAAVTAAKWSNYARRVDLCSAVISTILDMLSQNPMIAPAIGEDFVQEAKKVSAELRALQEEAANG